MEKTGRHDGAIRHIESVDLNAVWRGDRCTCFKIL